MACVYGDQMCLCGKCGHTKDDACEIFDQLSLKKKRCALCKEQGRIAQETGYCSAFSELPGVSVRRCGECRVAISGGKSTDYVQCPFRAHHGVTPGWRPPDWVCDLEDVTKDEEMVM